MPQNVKNRYKEDPDFRERMKANSRKRYNEMKEALETIKKLTLSADKSKP